MVVKKTVVFKPTVSANDLYQSSQSTTYVRDQTTGELKLISGMNVRTIIPEMFPGKASLIIGSDYNSGGGASTLYTVPTGKIMLLTGLSMQITYKASSFGNAGNLRVAGSDLMTLFGNDVAGTCALNFPLNAIIVLTENQTITISGSTGKVTAMAGYMGYELPASSIILS